MAGDDDHPTIGDALRALSPSAASLRTMAEAFRDAIARGLAGQPSSLSAGDASPELSAVAALLGGVGASSSLDERRALARLAHAVAQRSARMIAAALVGTLRFIDPALERLHTIAVDGSVYGGHPKFPELMRAGFADVAGPDAAARIHLDYIRDSTTLGAAVIVARS